MAFSMPTIATNVYGIPEQIEDKKDGLLISAGDVGGLAEQIKFLIENQDKAENFGITARKRLEKDFTYERMLEKYLNLAEKICAE